MDPMSRSKGATLMKKGSQVIRGESEEMQRRILLIRGGYENRIPDRSHGITISKQLWSTLLFSYLSSWINPLFLFLLPDVTASDPLRMKT